MSPKPQASTGQLAAEHPDRDEAVVRGKEDLDQHFGGLSAKFLTTSYDAHYDYPIPDWEPIEDRAAATAGEVYESLRGMVEGHWDHRSVGELEMVSPNLALVGCYFDDEDQRTKWEMYNEGYINGVLGERYAQLGEDARYVLLVKTYDGLVSGELHDAKHDVRFDTSVLLGIEIWCPTLEEYQQADPTRTKTPAGHDLSL